MPNLTSYQLGYLLDYLVAIKCSASNLVCSLSADKHHYSHLANNLPITAKQICLDFSKLFVPHPMLPGAIDTVNLVLQTEVQQLVDVNSGWHFSVLHASAEQIDSFEIRGMACEMQQIAPVTWSILNVLLSARDKVDLVGNGGSAVVDDEDEDDFYWNQVDELGSLEAHLELALQSEGLREKKKKLDRQSTLMIVSTGIACLLIAADDHPSP
jgi:hypothetical protein